MALFSDGIEEKLKGKRRGNDIHVTQDFNHYSCRIEPVHVCLLYQTNYPNLILLPWL